jgi:predicted metal-binding protein
LELQARRPAGQEFSNGLPEGRLKETRLTQTIVRPPDSAAVAAKAHGLAPQPAATILVCVTCRDGEAEGPRRGRLLFEALQARLDSSGLSGLALAPVECLSVCKRPCTVALAAPGKWTYVVGDLDWRGQIDEIVEAATRFAATADGIVPWRERPIAFRRGVISRTPPLPTPAIGG